MHDFRLESSDVNFDLSVTSFVDLPTARKNCANVFFHCIVQEVCFNIIALVVGITLKSADPCPIYRHAIFPGHGQQSGPGQTRKKLIQRITVKIDSVPKLFPSHSRNASSGEKRQYPFGFWSKMPPSFPGCE